MGAKYETFFNLEVRNRLKAPGFDERWFDLGRVDHDMPKNGVSLGTLDGKSVITGILCIADEPLDLTLHCGEWTFPFSGRGLQYLPAAVPGPVQLTVSGKKPKKGYALFRARILSLDSERVLI